MRTRGLASIDGIRELSTARRKSSAQWLVRFRGKTIRLPLRREHFSLDWNTVLSIVGHDQGVKTTYELLLSSDAPPEIFIDVGANHGTHSILFASHGVPTIAYEPNPKCIDYGKAVCALNGFAMQWRSVAIGDHDGDVELVYPAEETWLGSVDRDIVRGLAADRAVCVEPVKLRRLDGYADCFDQKRVVVKIDVEGAEMLVLKGASALLERSRPTIIFESNGQKGRPELSSLLSTWRYRIHGLPFLGKDRQNALSDGAFQASPAVNFLAMPEGRRQAPATARAPSGA